ncbi:MAG: hypothetical protein ACI843_002668 [Psychrobacter glaciei]|jgi:hypothetical protein
MRGYWGDCYLLNIKSIIICIFASFLLVACASNTEVGSNSYYGKWTLNEIIYKSGRSRVFTKEPRNFVHIKETEISEIIVGHGVRSYPYTQEGDVLILISGGEPDIWSVVESTEHSMEIDTPIGRYILSR